MRGVAVNGKFCAQPLTGVQRVGAELTRRLRTLHAEGEVLAGSALRVLCPPDAAPAAAAALGAEIRGRLRGVLWEQAELPGLAGADLLVNLCNVAPAARTGDVVLIHDAQALTAPASYSRPFRLYYGALLPWIARRARVVLTVSEHSRQALAAAGVAPADRIRVVPNGCDHLLRTPADRAVVDRLALGGRDYLLAPFSLAAHKNARLAAEVAARLSPEIPVVFYGSGDEGAARRAGWATPPNLRFAGRIGDAELRALMEGARALLFPSLTEGFGLPPLEAMRLGTPVIASPRGAIPEVCGDAVLYAEPDQAEAWSQIAAELVMEPDVRRTWGGRALERALGFSWSAAGRRLAAILEEAL